MNDDYADEEAAAAASLLIVLYSVFEARESRIRHRHAHRLYLCRNELMPNPRIDTPWQRLWASQEDRAFITTMGFDVATFRLLLEGPNRFGAQWENSTIPRGDVESQGEARLRRRSLDGAGALGLVLHYLGSSMLDITLQQVFALTPTTLSRYLNFAQNILHDVLKSLPEAHIAFPTTLEEYSHLSDLVCVRHPLLEGAFGSIDGLSLPVQVSNDPEIENATYNGWKTDHRVNNVIAFSSEGIIISAALNAPGSWHDAHVARPIFDQLGEYVPDGYFLVADSAFPRGTGQIDGKIQAALKGGDSLPREPAAQELTLKINDQLLSYRQTAEWGMRTIQGSFGRLRVPLPIQSNDDRYRLLNTVVHLTNVRARCVGISQISSVYANIWKSAEQQLWLDVGNIMFSDIRRFDRVARFHLVVVDADRED